MTGCTQKCLNSILEAIMKFLIAVNSCYSIIPLSSIGSYQLNKLIREKNIINSMKNKEGKSKHKKRYAKISIQKRLKLAKMVLEDGLTLTKVAKLLHIKRPTAKVILKRYKESGTFFHKKISKLSTKASISSNQEIKVQQIHEHDVSIELPPKEIQGFIKQQEPYQINPRWEYQKMESGYVFYYPIFAPYQSYM